MQKYCKQVRCCTANNTDKELSVATLENILGGNILRYGNINRLQEALLPFGDAFKDVLHCHLHYENYEKNKLKVILLRQFEMHPFYPIY
jgi:hypothetical protein